jgi:hypothetical protein
MPVIQTDLSEVKEPRPVPRATYALTISEANIIEDKHRVAVSIGIDDHLDAPNINHTLWLDKDTDEDWQRTSNALNTKRFLVAFGIPHDDTEYNTDDFAGAKAEMEVSLTDPDSQGRVWNRLILPRLPDEEEKAPATKKVAPPKKAARR